MSIENLAFSGGGGFLFGAVAGYVLKKVMKIAAIIIGLFVASLAYLSKGLLDVKWVAMGNVTRHTLKNFTATKPVEVGISYRLPIDNSTFSHIDTKLYIFSY